MSVLREVLSTPSRVKGVAKYFLEVKRKVKQETLECLLSPDALVNKNRNMIRNTINECKKMGLIQTSDQDELIFNSGLGIDNENELPQALVKLFTSEDNKENHDLINLITWYLTLEIQSAPTGKTQEEIWSKMQDILKEQGEIGSRLLGVLTDNGSDDISKLNNARFGQFEDWSLYLGFACNHVVLMPDPTDYIRAILKQIFQKDIRLSISEFVKRLSHICPVFETGSFREEIESPLNIREPKNLSSTTAFALFRLQNEGFIHLPNPLSDTDVWIFPFEDSGSRFTHIEKKEHR